jgi:hypothetical protein
MEMFLTISENTFRTRNELMVVSIKFVQVEASHLLPWGALSQGSRAVP